MQIVKPIILLLFNLIFLSQVNSVIMSLARLICQIFGVQVDIICIEALQLLVTDQVATMLNQPSPHTFVQSCIFIVKFIEHMAHMRSLE